MSLTPKDLIALGIKPGELFGKILRYCQTTEHALEVWNSREIVVRESVVMLTHSVWDWLCNAEFFQGMTSREFPDRHASNGEKRRWFESGSVIINGQALGPDDLAPLTVDTLVFFPRSPLRITML